MVAIDGPVTRLLPVTPNVTLPQEIAGGGKDYSKWGNEAFWQAIFRCEGRGMGRLIGVAACAIAIGLALAGCKAPATGAAAAKPEESGPTLGRNLVGEECRGTPGRDAVSDPNAPPRIDIACGSDKSLAGVVHGAVLPLGLPAAPPSIRRRARRWPASASQPGSIASPATGSPPRTATSR